ncbi:DNA mismatch repair protein Msh2 [Ophiocordyceps camponoti-floridani]|uniref:DNA mismatch repair protein Msh2 n=1 Tax=Ophiocordyceps camponoti-floridani TaxID=2030778 RepID=A0A8H4QDF3_9HYPO|nr:DNA mismatch repair protein Msh2 [Ophiocordyceps camponoti-floridani]
MPRPSRRRQLALPQDAQPIDTFTRVSKGHASSRDKLTIGSAADAPKTRKRKAASARDDERDDERDGLVRRTRSFPPSSDEDELRHPVSLKRICRRDDAEPQPQPRVPPKEKKVVEAPPSGVERAHRPGRPIAVAEVRSRGSNCRRVRCGAEIGLAQKSKESVSSIPCHLAELVGLNGALLRTVALHMAHNGRNAPVDMGSALSDVSRTWGKRQVTVADIRRCIALQSGDGDAASPLIVSDYGGGRICIELSPDFKGAIIDQDGLAKRFRDNLEALCARRAAEDASEVEKDGDTKMEEKDVDVLLQGLSIADLPQAAVADVAASAKMDPIRVKGQKALAQLKSGLAAKQLEKEAKQQAHRGGNISLLERLRAKGLARASEPLPPTAEELGRRAALHRVGEVAAIISMLSLSMSPSGRQAFTMAALSQKIRDSQRMPMSVDEAVACVRLITTELAPEWLRLVRLGGRENVVVQRGKQPVQRVLEERVQRQLAA